MNNETFEKLPPKLRLAFMMGTAAKFFGRERSTARTDLFALQGAGGTRTFRVPPGTPWLRPTPWSSAASQCPSCVSPPPEK
jgi:hypothetical protein